MARARNIKPSFFLNEDIVELPCEARLLFIGLWFFNYMGNVWHENQKPSGRNFRNEFSPLTDCRPRQSKMSSQIRSIHIGCDSVFCLNNHFHTKSQNGEMLSTFNHALFTLSSTLNKTIVKLALLCKVSTP